jgi:tetratricopeptide (TPR) repeat protein
MQEQGLEYYEALRAQGLEALGGTRFQEAFEHFDQAHQWAQQHGDALLRDQAFCSRSAVFIELFPEEEPLPELRRILMRNRDPWSCRLAAYTIARVYDMKQSYKKGLFYARIARDLSYQLDLDEWIASSHNQMGNLLLAESFFDEARAEYKKGLQFLQSSESVQYAYILENIGYCHAIEGDLDRSFPLLFESLRSLRRQSIRSGQAYPHLSLCYAYMEVGKYESALRHGLRALALNHNRQTHKNALYLLGQAANLMGDLEQAHDFLWRLHQDHYPDSPQIVDFLMQVDVRPFINLKA